MTTVFDVVQAPGGSPRVGMWVTVDLIAATDGAGAGWVSSGQFSIVGSQSVQTDGTGRWQLDLEPNGSITSPANTRYQVTENPPGDVPVVYVINVTTSASPVWARDILDVAPADLPAGVGTVPAGGTVGQVLTKASTTDFDTDWEDPTGGTGGGAVASVNGQTGTVVLDATDVGADPAGSASSAQTAAEAASDPAGAASSAVAAHNADTTAVHGIADTSALETTAGAQAKVDTLAATLGTAATADTTDFDAAGAAAAAQSAAEAASQPVDSDLTAIAALSTTVYGRSLLTQADAAALRTTAGLGTAATHAATDFDSAGAAAAAQAASQPVDSDLTAIAALTTTTFGRARLTDADAAALRTAAGLGTAATQNTTAFDAAGAAAAAQAAAIAASQPLDSDLTAIAALSTTSFGRGFLALADAAALRSTAAQVLTPGTLASRPAASAAPRQWYLATDDRGGTLYYSDGTTWTQYAPSAQQSGGTRLAYQQLAADVSTNTTADVDAITLTVTAGTRPLHLECYARIDVTTGTNDQPYMLIKEDGTGIGAFIASAQYSAGGSAHPIIYGVVDHSPAAGSHTYKLSMPKQTTNVWQMKAGVPALAIPHAWLRISEG